MLDGEREIIVNWINQYFEKRSSDGSRIEIRGNTIFKRTGFWTSVKLLTAL